MPDACQILAGGALEEPGAFRIDAKEFERRLESRRIRVSNTNEKE